MSVKELGQEKEAIKIVLESSCWRIKEKDENWSSYTPENLSTKSNVRQCMRKGGQEVNLSFMFCEKMNVI